MVLTSCWRCLRLPPRLLNTPATRVVLQTPSPLQPRSAPFTTTSVLLANPQKKQNTGQGNQKAIIAKQKTTSNKFQHKKKKKDIVASKPAYAIGQRKVLRKNIVLSNTNAPAVLLPEMSSEICGDENTIGGVFEIPGGVLDQLLALQTFKLGQHWRYFQKPSALVRKEGVEIGKLISWVNESGKEGEERCARRIVDGIGGSGKSIVLAQAITWALQSKWVVISIPNAQDLVIGHTEYEFDPAYNLWVQKEYTSALLGRIAKANNILKDFETTETHRIGKDEIKPTTLEKLVNIGAQEPTVAHDVFVALMKELSLPGRPPVLFALDNLNQISLPSVYRDTSFNHIHAHDLALPHMFLSYLSGKSQFPRGLVLAATSSVCRKTRDLDMALRGETPGPWDKVDTRIAPSVEGADVVRIEKLSREEVKVIMEWYNAGGVLNTPVTLETVTEKYAISCGNPKQLFASCLRLRY